MKKRITSLLLSIGMLVSLAAQHIEQVGAVGLSAQRVSVTYEGTAITDITIPQNEKKTVTAVCSSAREHNTYQWQILADVSADVWVDITGQSQPAIELSYALLSSVLDEAGSGYIRCNVSTEENIVYSDPVCATVSFTPEISCVPAPERQTMRRSNQALPAADDPEYVYITVNYLDASSGNQLYSPYYSQIERGTTFGEIVHSPTFLGFAPYYYANDLGKQNVNTDMKDQTNTDNPEHPDTTAAPAVTVNFHTLLGSAPVQENITVNVYYWAIDVPYAARYFFQNINDDYYTEQTNLYYVGKAKTGTIIEDEELFFHAGNPTGFTALYHYPESVAADGSTVFECYYDRNYYMMKFDMNGGYGVDSVYARYDTPFVVNTPTRHGYIFRGWDEVERTENGGYTDGDGQPDAVPNRVPDGNKFYKALWEKSNTTYMVVYWVENPDDDGDGNDENNYSFFGYNRYPAQAEETVIVNKDLTDAEGVEGDKKSEIPHYIYNEAKSDVTVTVDGNGTTIANVYFDRREYTLKFFYARRKGSRTFQVVGGSTYYFSSLGNENMSFLQLLENEPEAEWGNVQNIPELKAECQDRGYELGVEPGSNGGDAYYYLSFKAKFGQNLAELWPIDIFEPVEVSDQHTSNGCQYLEHAYFSAWNGEHKVKYTQDNPGADTIKGFYQRLDEHLLYDLGQFDNADTVHYLGFWDNGADVSWSVPRRWDYQLYVEDSNGEKVYNGVRYSLRHEFVTYDDNAAYNDEGEPVGIEKQTQTSLLGFTPVGRELVSQATITIPYQNSPWRSYEMDHYTLAFYYSRNQHSFKFFNYNLDKPWGDKEGIAFEDDIGTAIEGDIAHMKPNPPANLEQNAYYFEGWYTTTDCVPGSAFLQYDPETGQWSTGGAYFRYMPDWNVTFYAHWVPLDHEVRFFETYQHMLDYETTGDESLIYTTTRNGVANPPVWSVPHGNVLGSVDFPKHTEEDLEYQFRGWFYLNNGVKTMFTPGDMPVNRDLHLFADWGTFVPQPYCIQYVKYGTNEKIADDTFGYAYQGATRTFIPKAGDPFHQLYEGFNENWFPTLSSHSITIQPEQDKEKPVINTFIFEYVQAENIPYMVRYVDKSTGEELGCETDTTNKKAVVTERFKAFENRVPDAFYKRLVLSVKIDETGKPVTKPEDNVITFYYTSNVDVAPYAVHYMLQKPGTDGTLSEHFTESDIFTEGTGDIGKKLTIYPQIHTGYTMLDDAVVVNGGDNHNKEHVYKETTDGRDSFAFTVDASGTELYVYYKLNTYSYTVKHLVYGTEEELASETVASNQYGIVVTETAQSIAGYTALAPLSKSLTIRAYDEQSGAEDPNVIVFYYLPESYRVEYKVVGNGGGLDNLLEKAVGENGQYHFKGAVPTPFEGFELEGWYLDAECTKPVENAWVDEGGKLTPQVGAMKPEPDTNIYYAKFRELIGDLTITRQNAEDEGDGDQVFVYKITNKDDPQITMYIAITGNGTQTIHNLRYGRYTVQQMNDWSWRYSDEAAEIHHNGSTPPVEFGKAADKKQWLNGNSDVITNIKGEQR